MAGEGGGWPLLDWATPWFAPLAATGEAAEAAVQAGASVADALCGSARSDTPRFVGQHALPSGTPYESFIHASGSVPTRDNLHDFFNGLVWLRFAQAKRRLNVLQAGEIARNGIGAVRGPVRDAITVFDENGAVLQAPDALWQALAVRDWRRLFVDLRPLWREARVTLFGHALLEQLAMAPRKNLCAHVLRLPMEADPLDAALAAALRPEMLAVKPFLPLPVLGVPGWWSANDDAGFYDDPRVFRPLRTAALPAPTGA